jgi:hypothetical protein
MTMEGLPVAVAVLNNDLGMSAPLDPTTVQIVGQPLNGFAQVDPSTGKIWYFPDPDFDGIDDFMYEVSNVLGLVSNVATVTVFVFEDTQPPVIQNFMAVPQGGGVWILSGQVADDQPAGILVTFAGAVTGTAVTGADGSFTFNADVPFGTSGVVTAQAVNDEGLHSPLVNAYVFNR